MTHPLGAVLLKGMRLLSAACPFPLRSDVKCPQKVQAVAAYSPSPPSALPGAQLEAREGSHRLRCCAASPLHRMWYVIGTQPPLRLFHWLTRSTDAFPILGEMYKCARCDESFFCTNCLSSHPHTFFVRLGATPSTARREIKVY